MSISASKIRLCEVDWENPHLVGSWMPHPKTEILSQIGSATSAETGGMPTLRPINGMKTALPKCRLCILVRIRATVNLVRQ